MKRAIAAVLLPLLIAQPALAIDLGNLLKPLSGNNADSKGDIVNSVFDAGKNLIEANRDIGPAEEKVLGDGLAANILGAQPLLNNPAVQRYVNQIGRWVADQAGQSGVAWRFGVTDDPDLNSFSTPGGAILITKGLLLKLRNEAELACVLGHEVTHTLKHHHTRAIQASKGKDALGNVLQGVVSYKGGSANHQLGANAIKGLSEVQVRGLDKNDEFEADINGMVLCARAGYNPYALVGVLQTLDAVNPQDGSVALMFGTHPSPAERLSKIEELAGDKLDAYAGGTEDTARFRSIVGKLPTAPDTRTVKKAK
ncbi:Beta-barrel assembly-enhancing protease [Andreprevotia sp. IGB-42]|uniref:M48 family metalloprotease n=1 Tax=Andreprevotia sp. IGB-42 TaxID=2497473 RepID=UPI001356EB08|nr:M48 family metalloprotease [Andreprevotia sp. IGB-42]KAF0812036.1 Beta-barrel assembly-enhancing protease [Andreprevotia sp. IGB-42]